MEVELEIARALINKIKVDTAAIIADKDEIIARLEAQLIVQREQPAGVAEAESEAEASEAETNE